MFINVHKYFINLCLESRTVLLATHCVSATSNSSEKEKLLDAISFPKLHFSFRHYWVQR